MCLQMCINPVDSAGSGAYPFVMRTIRRQPKGKTEGVKFKVGVGLSAKPGNQGRTLRGRTTASAGGGGFDVKGFCGRFQIVRPDLTRLTGYSQRSVDQWATGDAPSSPARRHLKEVERLFDALADIMEPEYIGVWLKEPNPAFDGSTPLQVIERGEGDQLWRMIYRVETGEPL